MAELIVALDVQTREEAVERVKTIGDAVGFYKIGLELFSAEGPDVVKAVTKEKPFIVLAHMGGAKQIDLVERCLTGLPVYFDTSFVLDGTEKERIADVIRSHGIGKILFGTDSPWRSAKQYIGIIKSILPDPEERDAVFSKNCAGLLGV